MPSVVLVDPLWWVAARLRRIVTGLMVLALALGAAADAWGAVGSPLGRTPAVSAMASAPAPVTVTAPTESAAFSSTATVIAPPATPPDLAPGFDTRPVPGAADPEFALPALTATRASYAPDERPNQAPRTASLGQRAPPTH